MNYLPSRNAVFGVLGSAVVLTFPISSIRADGGSDNAAAAPASEVASAGAVIAKDKKTGELRPATAKEMKKLQAQTAAAREGIVKSKAPVEFRLANGGAGMTLDSSFEVYSLAAKSDDGKVRTACVTGDKVDSTLAAAAQNVSQTKKEVLDEK